MEVKLKVLTGASAGREIKLPVKKFIIGRGDECHLRPKSDLISRQHCAIIVEDAKVYVQDGSKNGTYVNDVRIVGQQELQPGDRLKLGELQFEVQFTMAMAGAKKPKVKSVADAAARTVQASGNSDADVMKWLDDDEMNLADTRGHMADTAALMQTNKNTADDATVVDDQSSARKGLKKEYGKLPDRPSAPPPKDSREAAMNSLKKLFKEK